MFFNDWQSVFRVVVVGILAYLGLVAFLRVSGKRTLAKMNAFDFIVTVALGSTLATVLLNKTVPLVDGLAGLATLIGMQYLVAWLQVRSRFVRQLAKSEPRLLLYQGEMLEQAMKDERITRGEVQSAIRSQGIGNQQEVYAVVLETDGTFSVIRDDAPMEHSTIAGVPGHQSERSENEQ